MSETVQKKAKPELTLVGNYHTFSLNAVLSLPQYDCSEPGRLAYSLAAGLVKLFVESSKAALLDILIESCNNKSM